MKLFTTSYLEEMDEMTKYGFELALQYVELAVQYDKDPVEYLKEKLRNWKKETKS